MINLYEKNTTNFNNNGVATFEPTECKFSASINDVWKLEATIPYDQEGKYKLFTNDMIIKVTDMDGVAEQSAMQLFRIYDYKKQDNSVYVLAYPVGLDARFDAFIQSLDLRGLPANSAISALSGVSDRYTVTTNKNNLPVKLSEESGLYRYTNLIAALNGDGGFTSLWGGEICYDNNTIKVNNALGSDNGAEVRYGKNLTSMTYDRDTSNVITRLFPISNDGEWLNHVEAYKIANTAYVDSPKINNYPIPHGYAVTAPYTLVQLSDNKSAEYTLSTQILNDISDMVGTKVHEITDDYLSTTGMNWAVEWIKMFYPLTMDGDGTEGFAERIGRLVTVDCVSPSTANLIKKGITAGFKGYFDSISAKRSWHKDGNNYICWQNEDISWHMVDAWAKDGTTWRRIGTNGVHQKGINATAKEADFKWFQPDKTTYKRYGWKKKNYYIHASEANGYVMHQLNGVWYVFDYDGQGFKGTEFLNKSFVGLPNGFIALYDAIVDVVRPYVSTWEGQLYNLLYTQMTAYCNNTFSSQKIDDPVTNVTVNLVDLSRTTEYKNYQSLVKVRLGDTVRCINYKTGIASTERAIAIEYDVLRKCNTSVTLGIASNTVISILSSFGSDNGVRTAEEETVVETPTAGVKDVYVNGESVVMGGIASIDLDLDSGLKYFVETENALYGSNDYMELLKDGRCALGTHTLISEEDSEYYYTRITVAVRPSIVQAGEDDTSVMIYVPQTMQPDDSYPLRIANIQDRNTGYGGILFLTNNYESFGEFTLVASYYSLNKGTGAVSYVEGEGNIYWPTQTETTKIARVYTIEGRELFYNAYIDYASTEVEIGDDTWYGLFLWKDGTRMTSCNFLPSIQEYLPKSELPHNIGTSILPYDTLGDFVEVAVPLWKPADGSCSGIGKANNLAFFAGADDEYGTNAPIKIFTDGTYQGLDKVEDVQSDGVSIVSNKIASVNTMTGATSESAGSKGLVPQPLSTDRSKYLKGDGSWSDISGGVTQTPTTQSDNSEYPLLLKHSANGQEETDTVKTTRDSRLGYNPSTNALYTSYYNNNTLVRQTIYGSAGIRTQGTDLYDRSVNAEYLQEGFKVKYTPTLTKGDLTEAGVVSQIDSGEEPVISFFNNRYGSSLLSNGVNKASTLNHESLNIFEDDWDEDYSAGSSEYTGFFAEKNRLGLTHQEWQQSSSTPTTSESIQMEIDDITMSGNTWDGTHTSLKDALANSGGGGGGIQAVELTQAQYDVLPLADKEDATKIYFVKD